MHYVGIDIGKEIHEASALDEQGKLLGSSIRFSNSWASYQRFLTWLPEGEVRVAMEATGHYWLSLYNFFKGNGYEVTVINLFKQRLIAAARYAEQRPISGIQSSLPTSCVPRSSIIAMFPKNGYRS